MFETLTTPFIEMFSSHPIIAAFVVIVLSLTSKYAWGYFAKKDENNFVIKKLEITKEINTTEILQKINQIEIQVSNLDSEVEQLKLKHTKNDEDIEDLNLELTKLQLKIDQFEYVINNIKAAKNIKAIKRN
jgi:peptidoglycan hydrolase CwlO-like protein